MAIKGGARPNGFVYDGAPVLPGYRRVVEPGTTVSVLLMLEDFGFCARGEGGPLVESGALDAPGGMLPTNTHGGSLSEAYIHGLNHYFEAALQLRGHAGERQVEDARLALVTAGAGPYGGASVLSAEQP